MRRPSPAVLIFLLALAARLAFLCFVDQPLLFSHQYTYFHNALRIATHSDPLHYVLTDDEWRTWDQHWTIAPLYYVFAALVLRISALHLFPLQVLQCGLDALVAVMVYDVARRIAGHWGVAAGVAYALYWPAIEGPSWVMTENLHTPLLVGGFLAAVRACEGGSPRRALLAGLTLGASALVRSVGSVFIGVAALVRFFLGPRTRRFWAAAALCAGGALAILPWTARNVFLRHDHILIESTAFENIWFANNFADPRRLARQQEIIHSQPTPAAKRAAALDFAVRGIRRHPDLFAEKISRNFWHLFRLEGLHTLLRAQRPFSPWRLALAVILDDVPLLVAVVLFPVLLFAPRPTPARILLMVWIAYYLLMVVVVFHNEIRYRSALVPFLLAGAAGGGWTLFRGAVSRVRLVLGLTLGLLIGLCVAAPFPRPAWKALEARWAVRSAITAGATVDDRSLLDAVARDPTSPRPWFDAGRAFAQRGDVRAAATAYERGNAINTTASVRGIVALPRLLREAGAEREADRALLVAQRFSWDTDSWLLLEAAWRELPPPRTDNIQVGGDDFGAVAGFLQPQGGDPRLSSHRLEWNKYMDPRAQPPPGLHRWTRHVAWLRAIPRRAASEHSVTLFMGSPYPSPIAFPEVRVRVGDEPARTFRLDRVIRAYEFRASAPVGAPIVVRIDSPTWNAVGEPAEKGVRVDRMTIAPAR